MSGFKWFSFYSVNIEEVDDQHKKLVSIINKLSEAMREGQGKTVLTETFNEMIDYTNYHFSTEEKLMTQYQYPDYADHKKEHDKLTKKTMDLKAEYDRGKPVITIDLLNFLTDWLIDHMSNTDSKYSAYLNACGVH